MLNLWLLKPSNMKEILSFSFIHKWLAFQMTGESLKNINPKEMLKRNTDPHTLESQDFKAFSWLMESLLTTSLLWQVLEFPEVIYECEYTTTASTPSTIVF